MEWSINKVSGRKVGGPCSSGPFPGHRTYSNCVWISSDAVEWRKPIAKSALGVVDGSPWVVKYLSSQPEHNNKFSLALSIESDYKRVIRNEANVYHRIRVGE